MHTSFMRLEMQEEENPMNGVIFPWGLRSPKIGVMPIEIVLFVLLYIYKNEYIV